MPATVKTALAVACVVSGALGARTRHRQQSNSTKRWTTKLLDGHMDIKRPAFLMHDKDTDEVVVSQFGKETPLGVFNPINMPAHSTISRIPVKTLADQLRSGHLTASLNNDVWVKSGLEWPNVLSKTPSSLGDYTVVPDGFLPPGKENGGMFLADSSGTVHRIAKYLKGAFYHEVEWHDFNNDGLPDLLTSRVIKGGWFFKPTFKGELIWLENPGKSKMLNTEWTEHKITDGPDVIFKSQPHGSGLAVFCTEFFRDVPRITVRLLSASGVQTDMRIIDDSVGKPFAVDLADLDGDGKKELLVTNHQDNEDAVKAGVFAYEMPSDLIKGSWPRHTLAQDVSKCKVDSPGVGSPGFARAFQPQVSTSASTPPHIIVAGDGSFDVWVLRPTGRFQYETEIIEIGGTTGELLIEDITGDGITDVIITDNDNFNLRALTFE